MARRAGRRGSFVKKSDLRKTEALNRSEVRACCSTNRNTAHLPDCVRPISRCAEKIGFRTRDEATVRAKALSAQHGLMTVYRCAGCRLYHFGHPRSAEEGL